MKEVKDFKICPQCGTKFTKEECFLEWRKSIKSVGRLESLWKKKRFCKYDCSTKFHAKSATEKRITEILQQPLKGTAPYEVWAVWNGKITKIKIKIFGKELICDVHE